MNGDDDTGEDFLESLMFVASKMCSHSNVILESQQKTAATLTIVATQGPYSRFEYTQLKIRAFEFSSNEILHFSPYKLLQVGVCIICTYIKEGDIKITLLI